MRNSCYYKDTDSLYIDLSEKKGADSKEVAEGVVLDFDSKGNLVGIDIDHASQLVDLKRLETNGIPLSDLLVKSSEINKPLQSI